MGYSAFVNCNCYKEGKLKENFYLSENIIEGAEGLELDLDWETNEEEHILFSRWKESKACEHEDMEYCYEELANISGMGAFRTICSELGIEEFPILNTYLPTSNDGYLPAKYAKGLLEELNKMKGIRTKENIQRTK